MSSSTNRCSDTQKIQDVLLRRRWLARHVFLYPSANTQIRMDYDIFIFIFYSKRILWILCSPKGFFHAHPKGYTPPPPPFWIYYVWRHIIFAYRYICMPFCSCFPIERSLVLEILIKFLSNACLRPIYGMQLRFTTQLFNVSSPRVRCQASILFSLWWTTAGSWE